MTVFQSFENITKDKLSILISHRLGSIKMADKIIVLDKGEIVEVGIHN